MKKILITVVLLISVALTAVCQIQVFTKFTEGQKMSPDINFFGYGPKLNTSGSLKIAYFALVERNWAEGLVGVSYSPKPWIELGAQVGLETNDNPYRYSGSIFMSKKAVSFSLCMEKGHGADNWWYKSVLAYQVSEKFSTGLMSWRFNGTGPFLKFATKNGLSFWVNPGYDIEFHEKELIVGLDIKI